MNAYVRHGSTRVMTPAGIGVIKVQYTDHWSAFDRGASPQTIPGLGASRCACAVKSFNLAKAAGIPTHFLEQVDPVSFFALEFAVPGKESLSGVTHGVVLDAEWLWRARVKGSLLKRIKEGKVSPTTLGFPEGTEVTDGMLLPQMLLECSTKFESVDRNLTDEEATQRLNFTPEMFGQAKDLLRQMLTVSNDYYHTVGFDSVDGKGELGRLHDGTFMAVDVFGTQDENRLLDSDTGDVYSKDLIRNYLTSQTVWKTSLDTAKAAFPNDKSKWPEYPILPDPLVELVSRRYAEVARRYASVDVFS